MNKGGFATLKGDSGLQTRLDQAGEGGVCPRAVSCSCLTLSCGVFGYARDLVLPTAPAFGSNFP